MKLRTTTCVLLAALPIGVLQAQGAIEAEARTFDVEDALARGCDILLEMQEGEGAREWPYEGVYRTNEGKRRRVIPIGYRVGGTAIASLALIDAPGYATHDARRGAVERGLEFILGALGEPLMQPSTEDTYDVRGWGHIYALLFLLRLQENGSVPEEQRETVAKATEWLVTALQDTAIDGAGGWNYGGRSRSSPFMTAPGLQALFQAAAHGYAVETSVVEEGLAALERGRAQSGSIAYSVPADSRADTEEEELSMMDKLPGSMGRMMIVEATLMAAGRGDDARLSASVEAFFEHWKQLEVRKQKTGTHIQPYGVAPYYFMFAHYYAAQAIEMLADADERERQRARLWQTLARVVEEEGGWNDRVFDRSRNYGTAMGMMALMMRDLPRPHLWPPNVKSKR